MTRFFGWRLSLSFAAVLIAVIATTAIGTEQAQAHSGGLHDRGWCVFEGGNGQLRYFDATTHNGTIDIFTNMTKWCDENKDGAHLTNSQKRRIDGAPGVGGLPEKTSTGNYPEGWFEAPDVCLLLPNSGVGNNADYNRLQHVYTTRAVELGIQLVYDVGANEITGITGAIVGTILAVSKVPTFIIEWRYDVQDECQEILERNTIQNIDAALAVLGTSLDSHDSNIDGDLQTHDGDIKNIVSGVQDALNTVIEMEYVHLQLIDVSAGIGGWRVFLLSASEAGVPVDVTCVSLWTAVFDGPFGWTDLSADYTCTPMVNAPTGIHKVEIVVSGSVPFDIQYFEIQVEHTHDDGTVHRGVAVFDRHHDGNNSLGQ